MTIVERFMELDLPADRCVIIGSGVLDALGLRRSTDIDLVVDEVLFAELRDTPGWQEEVRHEENVLLKHDVEAWTSWGSDGVPNFQDLFADSVTVSGVHFANPAFVIAQKVASGRPKDLRDIELLERYLHNDTVRQ